MTSSTRALLIFNPSAGRQGPRRQLPEAIATLESGGWTVERAATKGPDDAGSLAQIANAAGFDVIVVAGGDGTINQVANGLMTAESGREQAAALGLLPSGTANVLARDLGIPVPGPGQQNTLTAAARLLLRAKPTPVDVGLASGAGGRRYFLCWAGVGIDAAITAYAASSPQAKRRLGPLVFAAGALTQLHELRHAPSYKVTVDSQQWTGNGLLVVVSNIRQYAAILKMAPEASLTDGLLDVAFFRKAHPLAILRVLWLLRTGGHVDEPHVEYTRSQRVCIDSVSPQAVHLDAEPFGTTPLTVDVVPRSLVLLIPPSAPSSNKAAITNPQ